MRCELFILAAPNFGKVQYENIYPGTDLTYRGTQGQLEFDFLHHPGANQNTILIEFIGAKDILLSRSGELVVRTKYGQICFHQPAAYQLDQEARHMVAARYRQISKGRFGFAVGPYDVTNPP